ncbi:energy-coupling factor ABC transporter permease [Corynebacterium pelargi]|uniref:Cobalt transport protein CbiM n=1 Tax=Corynebacterium pelargi TaxID=1471400 RepID=A0A410W9X2_9CORY|nr:energy-coupling factor ABC transporter permease [Corynebacterium pelargi]QAU52745.1 Cobalt transport protein CbiM [Corynebacterium pelargi]GGG78517.1 cobalt transport protein CbiM [Corynebacterium pelargi]
MHIAEGFLPVSHCVAWGAASAPFVLYGAKAVKTQLKEQPGTGMLLGAAGAFTFVLSALKMPSFTGSSSHPTGTGLGAVLFKPPVMALLGSIVLLFQALLLAHGGITTLGANIFSMAIVGPWIGYGAWKLCRGWGVSAEVGVFFAALFADLSTYVVTATQLAAAHHDAGFFNAWITFLSLYAPTQLPIAAAEAIVTVLIFRALATIARSDMLRLGVIDAEKSEAKGATPQEVA